MLYPAVYYLLANKGGADVTLIAFDLFDHLDLKAQVAQTLGQHSVGLVKESAHCHQCYIPDGQVI